MFIFFICEYRVQQSTSVYMWIFVHMVISDSHRSRLNHGPINNRLSTVISSTGPAGSLYQCVDVYMFVSFRRFRVCLFLSSIIQIKWYLFIFMCNHCASDLYPCMYVIVRVYLSCLCTAACICACLFCHILKTLFQVWERKKPSFYDFLNLFH